MKGNKPQNDLLKVPHIPTWDPAEWAEELHKVTDDVPALEALLKQNPAAVEAKDMFGQTLAHIAAGDGNVEVLKLLKQHNADLNAVTTPNIDPSDPEAFALKWTPLHYAANEGKTKAVEWLLENGADINARDNAEDKATPLAVATSEGHKDTALALLQKGAVVDPSIKEAVEELTAVKGKFTAQLKSSSPGHGQQNMLL